METAVYILGSILLLIPLLILLIRWAFPFDPDFDPDEPVDTTIHYYPEEWIADD